MCVCGDTGGSFKFTIIPTKLGHIDVTAEASHTSAIIANCQSSAGLPLHRDKVIKKLLVEVMLHAISQNMHACMLFLTGVKTSPVWRRGKEYVAVYEANLDFVDGWTPRR